MNKIKFKLNFFDLILIILVVAIAAGVIVFKFTNIGRGNSSGVNTSESTIKYLVRLDEVDDSTSKLIKAGDRLIDLVNKNDMGTVESVEFKPYTTATTDYTTGEIKSQEVPGKSCAYITLTANATQTESTILVENAYDIKVGALVSVSGPKYSGYGAIIDIERGDN